jgi:hypothetical protein
MGFASGGVTCKLEVLCFYSISVLADSFVLRNRRLRQAFSVMHKRRTTELHRQKLTDNFISEQHTDRITTGQRVNRHSMPDFLYFLFSPPHIFIQFSRHTASTFANRTSQHTNQSLQKSLLANRTQAHPPPHNSNFRQFINIAAVS